MFSKIRHNKVPEVEQLFNKGKLQTHLVAGSSGPLSESLETQNAGRPHLKPESISNPSYVIQAFPLTRGTATAILLSWLVRFVPLDPGGGKVQQYRVCGGRQDQR